MSLPQFKETGERGCDRQQLASQMWPGLESWKKRVLFPFLDCGFAQIFGQIVSTKVMLHEPKRDSISVQVGGCSRTKHNTRLFLIIYIHLKSGIFVCRKRLLLLSRYLISFNRKYLLVLDRGISNEEVSTRAVIKRRGPWIPPGYYERGLWLLS